MRGYNRMQVMNSGVVRIRVPFCFRVFAAAARSMFVSYLSVIGRALR